LTGPETGTMPLLPQAEAEAEAAAVGAELLEVA
jgi:hypothetical protein